MRKHTRRKVWGLGDAVSVAISGACVIDDKRLGLLRAAEREALDAFQFGHATWKHWGCITALVQAARVLVEMGVGPEVLPSIEAVERFLEAAQARHATTGRLGATGPDLQAVRDLSEYHDLQRTSIDLATYQRAVEKAINRARNATSSPKPCAA
ncbi:hypothetical protein J2W28_001014 [Variovorax boronicumulans]|uniref:hypothetical protein n=1 Tax=Variovorax boronicumulans TaxID=436515 RepID=UPI00277DF9AE|nr:hypothetical protein [Variovorax boronicumulans]MDP9991986.1 hypothetical protein [Variovorax boronicumulans]MDQ0001881.1 hypothetical protein [Variovorax boronicumulans]